MTALEIVGEGESLQEAREQVESKIRSIKGPFLRSEAIISDGKPETTRSVAQTTGEAFEKARKDVPTDAEVLDKKVCLSAEQKEITVEALDEQNARKQAKERIDETATLTSATLVSPSKKGVLGIGRKPSVYKIQVFQPAVVEITYKQKAKIVTSVVTPAERLPEFEKLMVELISIGVAQGYLGEGPGFHPNGKGMESGKNIRARRIGEELYEMGGQGLMKLAWNIVRESAADEKHLEYAWNGIGGWLA